MQRSRWLATLVVVALALLVLPALAGAAEPPNQNDRCSAAGRNICGTTGVGQYDTYRYGLRWFGDYRGAVPGKSQTFCIDLRFWYPNPAYRYKTIPSAGLRNRDGEAVTAVRQQQMAYAMWNYGRTNNPRQQAAVMLLVHELMGDGAPGEVDPAAIGSDVASLYARIARDAARYHGPYRIKIDMPDKLAVARKTSVSIRVLSATGRPVPNLRLALTASGASGLPDELRTNGSGEARLSLTPASATDVRLTVRATVASTLPELFGATTSPAVRNAQRLAAPASQVLQETVAAPAAPSPLVVTSTATPDRLLVGADSTDKVVVKGALPTWKATVAVRVFGPFRTAADIRCDGAPAVEGSFETSGPGTYTTAAVRLERPGWYVYQEVVPSDAAHVGLTTPCDDPAERFRVEVQPAVHTIVSAPTTAPGTTIFDRVEVTGLAGESVVVNASLYGPFPTPEAIVCTIPPIWTGTIAASADGEYRTEPVLLTVGGYYTYVETIAESELVRPVATACGEAVETAIVVGQPTLATQVSAQEAKPGASITDSVLVSGLGVLTATVQVELWGPYATREAMDCAGTPAATGTFTANGDGTYTTEPIVLDVAGYYTYRESIVATPAINAVTTACGEATETTLVSATPSVKTVVSDEVVRPGSRISDTLRVQGLGKTPARIVVELFGPFATRDAIRCDGEPYWRATVTAQGDGTLQSPTTVVRTAGFYTYRERLLGAPNVEGAVAECALVAETALGAPAVSTGRGDVVRHVAAADAGGRTPTRVRIGALTIDAPVTPVGIDLRNGALGVPGNIGRLGWWRDGAAPGDRNGAVLIAGHVDSATAGVGAFFRLPRASRGDRVQVTTRDGRTRTYRVTQVQTMPKRQLPTSIYSLGGPARLVLVTCGGPFDVAAGHYRDNVVVTAVPA